MSEPIEFTIGLMRVTRPEPFGLAPETSSTYWKVLLQITPPDIIFETITLGLRQEGHFQMLLATYQGAHLSNWLLTYLQQMATSMTKITDASTATSILIKVSVLMVFVFDISATVIMCVLFVCMLHLHGNQCGLLTNCLHLGGVLRCRWIHTQQQTLRWYKKTSPRWCVLYICSVADLPAADETGPSSCLGILFISWHLMDFSSQSSRPAPSIGIGRYLPAHSWIR
jgi:hypothetical protein